MAPAPPNNGFKELEQLFMEQPEWVGRPLQDSDVENFRQLAMDKARRINAWVVDYLSPAPEISPPEMKARRQEIYDCFFRWAECIDVNSGGDYIRGHLQRVSSLAGFLARAHIIGNQAQYDSYDADSYAEDVAKAAALNDIGYLGLPLQLLTSNDVYARNSPEREIIGAHVDCGRIILTIPGYEEGKDTRVPLARRIAWSHHWPHRGQFAGVAGIIVGVVDKVDAITSRRGYKAAFSFDKVRAELQPYAEHEESRPVLDTFFRHEKEIRELCDQLHQ